MKKKVTQWNKLLKLINRTSIGDVISRSQVLICATKNPNPHLIYSIDSYRRILVLLNILKATPKLGRYLVEDHISDKKLTYRTARKIAYENLKSSNLRSLKLSV